MLAHMVFSMHNNLAERLIQIYPLFLNKIPDDYNVTKLSFE